MSRSSSAPVSARRSVATSTARTESPPTRKKSSPSWISARPSRSRQTAATPSLRSTVRSDIATPFGSGPADGQPAADRQRVQSRAREGGHRLSRRPHDRLAPQVEGRVQQHRRAPVVAEPPDQAPEARRAVPFDDLHAGRAVHVGDRGQQLPVLLPYLGGEEHVPVQALPAG